MTCSLIGTWVSLVALAAIGASAPAHGQTPADACALPAASDTEAIDARLTGLTAAIEERLASGASAADLIECEARTHRVDGRLRVVDRERAALSALERLPSEEWSRRQLYLALQIISSMARQPGASATVGQRDRIGERYATYLDDLCIASMEQGDEPTCVRALHATFIDPATREPTFALVASDMARDVFTRRIGVHFDTPEQRRQAAGYMGTDAVLPWLDRLRADPMGGLLAWRAGGLLTVAEGPGTCAAITGLLRTVALAESLPATRSRLAVVTIALEQAGTVRKLIGEYLDQTTTQSVRCPAPVAALRQLISAGKRLLAGASPKTSAEYIALSRAFDEAVPSYIDQLMAEGHDEEARREAAALNRRADAVMPEAGMLRLVSSTLEARPRDRRALGQANAAFRSARRRGLSCGRDRPSDARFLEMMASIYHKANQAGMQSRLLDAIPTCLESGGFITLAEGPK